MKISRQTVDLSAYPDLVVIYLGMRVNRLGGIAKLITMGPKIQASVNAKPDGLLLHETLYYSLFPLHVGMRQYWRDFQSLETWARSLPHQKWWSDFVRDPGGTGFWHETYFRAVGSKPSTMPCPRPWDCCSSRRHMPRAARCSPRAGGQESKASLPQPRP